MHRKFYFGKWFKIFMGIIYIFIFLGVIGLVLRDFSEKLKITFLPQTPLIIIMLFFIIGSIYANKLGIGAIAKANVLIVILLLLGIFVTFTGVIKMMDIDRIFPILGNGIRETFMMNFTNLYAFTGIGYLYFIKPFLNKRESINKIAFTGTIISAVYLFICILAFILVLPTKIIADSSFSIYFISRMVSIGNFLERIESVFIFSWILATLSYISISLFFALNIFEDISGECLRRNSKIVTDSKYREKGVITNIKSSDVSRYCFGLIVLGLALIPKNFEQIHYLSNIFQIIVVLVVFVLSFGVVFLANIKQRKRREKLNETSN